MSEVVIDASVTAPFLLADEAGDQSDAVLDALTGGQAVVPGHWRLEVANLGRRGLRRGRISREEFVRGIALLARLPISVDDSTDELAWTRILDLANAHELTTYDAAYLELAKRLGAPIATTDHALQRAARAEGVRIFER